jgi:hypothetical protein
MVKCFAQPRWQRARALLPLAQQGAVLLSSSQTAQATFRPLSQPLRGWGPSVLS